MREEEGLEIQERRRDVIITMVDEFSVFRPKNTDLDDLIGTRDGEVQDPAGKFQKPLEEKTQAQVPWKGPERLPSPTWPLPRGGEARCAEALLARDSSCEGGARP